MIRQYYHRAYSYPVFSKHISVKVLWLISCGFPSGRTHAATSSRRNIRGIRSWTDRNSSVAPRVRTENTGICSPLRSSILYNPASMVVWLSFGCIRYLSPTFDRFPSGLLKCSHSKYQLHGITHRRRNHESFHISFWLAVSKRQLTMGASVASWLNPQSIGNTAILPSLFGARTAITSVGRISPHMISGLLRCLIMSSASFRFCALLIIGA